MSSTDTDLISAIFAARLHDLTPASECHTAQVIYSPVFHDPEVTKHCAAVLSVDELQRADLFASHTGKTLFIQRRAFRRFCGARVLGCAKPLSQVAFKETDKGRPYLPGLPNVWFSFSSCRIGFLAGWSSSQAIGVDIEDPMLNLETKELSKHFFTRAEFEALDGTVGMPGRNTFFAFWGLKEAALKSIGEGIPFGLDAFEFELEPRLRMVNAPVDHGGPEQYTPHLIEEPGSCAVVLRKLV